MNFLMVDKVFLTAMGGIFTLLFIASLITAAFRRFRPQKDTTEVILRIKSWWVMVILFCVVMVIGRATSIIFFCFVSFIALKEYLSLMPSRRADRRVLFWAYLAIPIQYWWIYTSCYGMFIIFIPVYAFLFLPMRMVIIGNTKGFLHAVGTLHWGLMTTVFSISHLAYLLVLPGEDATMTSGPCLVFYLLCLTELNDVFQWVWGKSFGKRKVMPLVSPNKSWAGLIGGVLTTVLLSYLLAPFLTPLSRIHAVIAGIIIGIGGFIGDVTISAVKRDIGIDNSGSILPGHGGILDRVDSLTYTAPLFLHFIRYLYFS